MSCFITTRQDDFEALTRLLAYQHWNQLPHHDLDSQLLLGGLYLSLGLHNEAGERFSKLLTPNVPQGVRNRAWFYLGQIWYARGYLDKAVDALRQVQGKLPEQQEAQRIHLLANALLRQGHFDEAIALLKAFNGPPDWLAFAQFNLGVALVRQQRMAEADTNLTAVGTLSSTRPELLALRDRANLALGFAYLQANQPEKARVAAGARAPEWRLLKQGTVGIGMGRRRPRGLSGRPLALDRTAAPQPAGLRRPGVVSGSAVCLWQA